MKEVLKSLFSEFKRRNLEVYLVGGAVRDYLQNKEPTDYDFTTPHTPDEIIDAFRGIVNPKTKNSSKFGTVFLNMNEHEIEITTFREEIINRNMIGDGRQPKTYFTKDLVTDSFRRDFPINALYMNDTFIIIDPTEFGKKDLKNNILRCVGETRHRFLEDPLRVLRAIRFMTMGYKPSKDIIFFLKTIKLDVLMKNLSIERIRDEFLKIIGINALKGLKLLKKYKLLEIIIPDAKLMYGYNQNVPDHHKWGLFNHSVLTAHKMWEIRPNDTELIMIAFLHDIGKPISMAQFQTYHHHADFGSLIVEQIFNKMKFSNKSTYRAKMLVEHHMRLHMNDFRQNKLKTMHILRKLENRHDIYDLHFADLWGSRFEFKTQVIETMPRNEIDGHTCIDILKELNSENYSIIGEMIEKAWQLIFKNTLISKESLRNRVKNFARSKIE